ncbi:Hypothetical_protein [Hexamita inflata]|uniref:Hypothetical_protein n=1 Tax=Hexamita inflata TaxID=28002 RepID=A0AA86N4D2_9EUKA|nr:Hypothetical protein HINF_LOCUS188 [Hexamita inflata]
MNRFSLQAFHYYKRVLQLLTIQSLQMNGKPLHFSFSQAPFHFNTSAENAFRLFGQYLNLAVVQRLVACTGPKVALKQPRGQFDEAHFWTFVNTLLVMFISPRRSLQEYWADDEILNNAYVKKMGSQDQFALVHGCISWEEDDGALGRNWLQAQIIATVQNQMYSVVNLQINIFMKTVNDFHFQFSYINDMYTQFSGNYYNSYLKLVNSFQFTSIFFSIFKHLMKNTFLLMFKLPVSRLSFYQKIQKIVFLTFSLLSMQIGTYISG